MGVIELQQASFSYDGKTDIFCNLTCTISTDNIFCILGPNGIGKSTLLNGIMNLHPLKSGRVLIDGRDVKSYPPKELARKVAYIPQTYQMVFPYRVLDLILMGRTPHLNDANKPSQDDYDKAMEAVCALRLEPYLDRACTQLSGGQLQMVMLARAIAQEADFLILDEPTSHLDYGKQMETLKMMYRMHERGIGIIFTSHNPDHAFLICDRVAIMNHKTFQETGSPQDVITASTLSEIYGARLQLIRYGDELRGTVCAPASLDIEEW
ncbi:ABC transporter ATP-binding protein [Adlercreutzia sp. ZJ473]|uniref:ABC transporter ATP-binding protein n=1 Tax=Adlercreutzia sp. ZJ473 TaxID=2722822 RepID=UPI001555B526|nr:ABC transporter ATP-binding protein [Adlercreutzia sp. ZJ473]